jgi:hypothetical protein
MKTIYLLLLLTSIFYLVACNLNSSESMLDFKHEKFVRDSTHIADSLNRAAILSIINEAINLDGVFEEINGEEYYTFGDTLIPSKLISENWNSYDEAVQAIEKYIDDIEVVPSNTSEYHYNEARKNINYQIDLFDYAFASIYTTNKEILQAINYSPNPQTTRNSSEDYVEKIRLKLENGQFILYPLDAYKVVLGKVFYIKFGENSDEKLSRWYKILELKYSEISRDEAYRSHVQELHRRYE